MSSSDEILARLDEQQRQVALTDGPIVVFAGAGSGKTRAITHRIAYRELAGLSTAQHTLALTFTTRAAGEMRSRLRELGVGNTVARTFHAAALRQLNYFWPKITKTQIPRLVPSKAKYIGMAIRQNGLKESNTLLADVGSEIEWAKVNQIDHDDYQKQATNRVLRGDLSLEQMEQIYRDYDEIKNLDGAIDFEDVLLLTAALLAESPIHLAEIQAQYRSFVVDEYQDISPIQQRLLELWLGDRNQLCAVGDVNQTIYSFAGADPKIFMNLPQRFPEATVLRLTTNYRSTSNIVNFANQINKNSSSALDLHPIRSSGAEIAFNVFDAEAEEAAQIARELRGRTDLDQVSILYRTNSQSAALENALNQERVGYAVRNGEGFFQHPKVREALRLLRAEALSSEVQITVGDRVLEVLRVLNWHPESSPSAEGASRDEWEMLNALHKLSQEFENYDELIQELEDRSQHSHAPSRNVVTLASLHSVKGMEWPEVYIIGVNEGTIPYALARDSAAIEEERRLFYVGITRAKDKLAISWTRQPSQFLKVSGALPATSMSISSTLTCIVCGKPLKSGSEKKRGRCADCPSEYDEQLFEDLRSWRYRKAQELDLPAFVIFTDATLEAIAHHLPMNDQQLLAISGIGARKLNDYGADILQLVKSRSSR